jgi:hypothetical protein
MESRAADARAGFQRILRDAGSYIVLTPTPVKLQLDDFPLSANPFMYGTACRVRFVCRLTNLHRPNPLTPRTTSWASLRRTRTFWTLRL